MLNRELGTSMMDPQQRQERRKARMRLERKGEASIFESSDALQRRATRGARARKLAAHKRVTRSQMEAGSTKEEFLPVPVKAAPTEALSLVRLLSAIRGGGLQDVGYDGVRRKSCFRVYMLAVLGIIAVGLIIGISVGVTLSSKAASSSSSAIVTSVASRRHRC